MGNTNSSEARNLTKVSLSDKKTTYIRTNPLKDKDLARGDVKEMKAGDSISGILTKKFDDVSKFGTKECYVIETSPEMDTILKQSGNLKALMAKVPVGAYVEVQYKGKTEMKSGPYKGTMAHSFSVAYEQI